MKEEPALKKMRLRAGVSVALCLMLILCFPTGCAGEEENQAAATLGRLLTRIRTGGEGEPAGGGSTGVDSDSLEAATNDELFEMSRLIDEELTKRGFYPDETAAEGTSRKHEFPDATVCGGMLSRVDSIVAFGDSIFTGFNIVNGRGVVQQLAEMMNLPLICYAEPSATLTTRGTLSRNVVQQVIDYVPEPGTTPLIIIDGGTVDQYEYNLANLGEYGSQDPDTIYGAVLYIVQALEMKGIESWQIVLTTPIPKGIQGDAELRSRVDAQLTMMGLAIYQVGVAMRCNVINGYHTVFGSVEDYNLKAILMPDDTHPSEVGANYYADFILKTLT